MRIAYTTTFDAEDVHNWSGTPFHMSRALAKEGTTLDYFGSLNRKLPPFFKVKQMYKKWFCNQRESPRFNIVAAKHYSLQISQQLKNRTFDAILSPLINPISYLECKQPIVLWTDALYAALLGFYPPFSYHSSATIQQGNEITRACLSRTALAIFSSDWAANSAIELYGACQSKVKVVPFGANIDAFPEYLEIKNIVKNRNQSKIKLLFLAKSWERKGGDIVLAVTKMLHEAGVAVELTIVGYQPPQLTNPPSYIRCLGFISKHTPEGKEKIRQLLAETHFLFVPSRAEAYGIVFCEANAFAVPCLTTYIGGINTIVKDGLNGMTFSLDANPTAYCDYLVNLMANRNEYESLALSSYEQFITRLNWKTAAQQVKSYIAEVV